MLDSLHWYLFVLGFGQIIFVYILYLAMVKDEMRVLFILLLNRNNVLFQHDMARALGIVLALEIVGLVIFCLLNRYDIQ